MGRMLKIAVLCLAALGAANAAAAVDWESIKLDQPVLITPIGQSADGLMVKVLLSRAGIRFTLEDKAQADDVANYKAIIMVVGFSSKGLGAAGTSQEDEIGRTKALIEEARTRNIPIVFAHIGGQNRRGPNTQQLIDVVAPAAYCMVFVNDGNADGALSVLAEKYGYPYRSCDRVSASGALFAELFN